MAYTISNENYRRSSEYETRGTNGGGDGDMNGRYSRGAATLPTIKLVLVGDQSVGKSSLIARYTKGDFAGEHNTVATVGVEFFSKIVTVGGGHGDVRVQVWDTAGQEKHRSLTKQVFRGARGVMIVYDITNRNSFESLPLWLSEIKAEVHATCSFLLVGNKYDLVGAASSSNSNYVSTSPPQPAFASPSSFAPYDRAGGGTNTPQFGSDRSIPPSPSNAYNNNNNYNNNRQRGPYGGSPQTPPPPIPLSPPHRFSSAGAGAGARSSQYHHQRTISSCSTGGAKVEKYTFTSGGAGSTPTSNSQCTTPSNQWGEGGGGGSRSRNNDYYRGVSPRESGIDGRGGGWGEGNAATHGSNYNYNNYNNNMYGSTSSISSQKGSNYQHNNNNRYDPDENWGSPPRDLGQTQRFLYTSGGQGSTSTPPLVPARRPSGSSNNYYGSPDYPTSRNTNNNNNYISRSGSDRPTYSGGGGGGGGLRSGSANGGNTGPTGMMNAARGIINSRSRQVTLKEADEFARSNGMSFLETSAKDRTNVERAFLWLIQNVMETSGGYMPSPSNGALGGVGGSNTNNYLQAGAKSGASASNSANNNANYYGYNMKTNRNSVNLSGKDRPRGAGEGYVAKKRRKGEDSDEEEGEEKSSGCPC